MNSAWEQEFEAQMRAVMDGKAKLADLRLLDDLLAENPEAMDAYISLIKVDAMLRWRSPQGKQEHGIEGEAAAISLSQRVAKDRVDGEALHTCVPTPQGLPIQPYLHTVYGEVGYFSGWPAAYLVATAVLGVGLLVGALMHLSDSVPMASKSTLPTQGQASPEGKKLFVGRITALVDCQWADPNTAVPGPVAVPLGRKYALAAGLLEITYDSGATVILEGPCTYEIESPAGGFLSRGKLVARVERKRAGVQGSESPNSKSQIQDPSLLATRCPLFTVKTPTAIVTDLGTEFGVEVTEDGDTTSHVFRGTVSVEAVSAAGANKAPASILRENMSARVEANRDPHLGMPQVTIVPSSASPVPFVRVLPKPTITAFDLVDVVAGGDGFSSRRSAGIDVTTGRPVDAIMTPSPENPLQVLTGDHQYHRVAGLRFVDGVFIPDGSDRPVQTDSAGHLFQGFPPTTNTTSNHLWVGGPMPVRLDPPWNQLRGSVGELSGVDYAADGHCMLFLHANKGITFDLDAIRQANPAKRILRFRAVAGNSEPAYQRGLDFYSDIWVLVDGQVRFERRKVRGWNPAVDVLIPIAEKDRFLTLAATDGGDGGIGWDWIVFGDPRLDIIGPSPDSQAE